jgi:hypothetical protein
VAFPPDLCHFRPLLPTSGAITGNKNGAWFCARHFKIRNVRMVGEPAYVPQPQAVAGLQPGGGAVVGAVNAIPGPRKNHALAGNDAGHVLPGQEAVDGTPPVIFAPGRDQTFFCR